MGVPVATITSEGRRLAAAIELLSLEIKRELNRIPEATLVLLDGSAGGRSFTVSNDAFFELGKRITIALRYEGEHDTTLFEGLVVRHAVESRSEGALLRVALKDRAFKLTRERSSAVFRGYRDEDAIRELVTDAGLTVGALAATTAKHEELVQYHASDWDFIVARADVQGLVVDVELGTVSVRPMVPAGPPRRTLAYGLGGVSELELELDATEQWSRVVSRGWDVRAQQLGVPVAADEPRVHVGKQGKLDPRAVAAKLGSVEYTLLHPATLPQDELKAWADARMLRSRLALLRGVAVIGGDPALAPLDTVELTGIGDRFDGQALVSAVTHRVDEAGWQTELRLGLSPEWFARRPDIAEVAAGGLLPPIGGLQIATVAAFEADAQGEHRIKVKLPGLPDQQGFVWARLARPDAGKDRGHAFWPEAGDEVVVGFLDGDPRQAIVLGALYSAANPPPAQVGPPSDGNPRRAIVSRAGSVVCFDDEKRAIAIETPAKSRIVIDDDAQAITIADQHGNTVTLDARGITLKSASDFLIDAAGKVTIKGSAVDVQ